MAWQNRLVQCFRLPNSCSCRVSSRSGSVSPRLLHLADRDDHAKPDVRAHHVAPGLEGIYPLSRLRDGLFAMLLDEVPRRLLDMKIWNRHAVIIGEFMAGRWRAHRS